MTTCPAPSVAPADVDALDVPTSAPWSQDDLRPAGACERHPAGPGHGHRVTVQADYPVVLTDVDGLKVLVPRRGSGGVRVDDWAAIDAERLVQPAVEVHRCHWCHGVLVAVGASLSTPDEYRWFEVVAAEHGIGWRPDAPDYLAWLADEPSDPTAPTTALPAALSPGNGQGTGQPERATPGNCPAGPGHPTGAEDQRQAEGER